MPVSSRMGQIVQGGDDGPAVHLGLVDLLGAVIEAGGVAEAHGVGGGKEAEGRVRADDLRLVEQGELAGGFENALDDEHHVGAAGVIFVEDQRHIVLIGPGQNAFAEFGDLLAILQHDGILADQIDAADVAVEIDADAGPVEAGGDLLDMGRLAGAMIAGDHHAAVVGKARQDRQRGLAVEKIILIEIGHVFGGRGIGRARSCSIQSRRAGFTDAVVSGIPWASPFAILFICSFFSSGRVMECSGF